MYISKITFLEVFKSSLLINSNQKIRKNNLTTLNGLTNVLFNKFPKYEIPQKIKQRINNQNNFDISIHLFFPDFFHHKNKHL